MSYILDALKRAEQQRGAPARAAASLPRAIATELEPRARWPWIVGGLAGLALIASAVAFWPAREPTLTASAPPIVSPAPPAAGSGALPTAGSTGAPAVPSPAPRATGATPAEPALPPARIEPPARPSAALPPRAHLAPPAPRLAAPRPPAVSGEAAASRQSAAASEQVPRTPPAPAGEPRSALTRLTPSVTPPSPSARPAPRAEERPAPVRPADVTRATPPAPATGGGDLKAMAAKLSIQVLSWAPERKDRFVFLNGRKYGEGQLIEDKILVEQIMEDGVVLALQGERVTLKGR
jgi:hypothetical protein